MDTLMIFILIGIAHGLFYTTWWRQIFEYKADKGNDELYKKIAENIKSAPISWKLEHIIHIFIGVFLGWIMLWVLLDLRLHLFDGKAETNNLGFIDLALFLLSFVGINGRLPTIAHSIEKWFGWSGK